MARKLSLYIMSAFYLVAGINHFLNKEFYLKIMPAWIGYHEELVAISGILEIGLAILLLPVKSRHFAAWGIIVLLIAIFPANIQMMINYSRDDDPNLWIAILRLPVQVLLIWWASMFVRKIN